MIVLIVAFYHSKTYYQVQLFSSMNLSYACKLEIMFEDIFFLLMERV